MKDMLCHESSIDVQRPQHHRVHKHPPDQRRRGAFIQARHALIADRLQDALQRATEARGLGCLKPDLDGVERMADCKDSRM